VLSGRPLAGARDVVCIQDTAIEYQTNMAIAVENARGVRVWLPISQLEFYADGRISVPRWLAEEKELAARG
jgi:hypothetical protein